MTYQMPVLRFLNDNFHFSQSPSSPVSTRGETPLPGYPGEPPSALYRDEEGEEISVLCGTCPAVNYSLEEDLQVNTSLQESNNEDQDTDKT